jgi:hypothetical protein
LKDCVRSFQRDVARFRVKHLLAGSHGRDARVSAVELPF